MASRSPPFIPLSRQPVRLTPPKPRYSLSDTLSDLLARAGVGKSDTIRVTGPAGLAALLWFCRHGYEQVGLVSAGRGPSDESDLLLVPQTCSIVDLEELLRRGPHPRDGGVLIVQTRESHAPGPDPVHDLLGRSGYRIERCLHGRRRELHVARRLPHAPGRMAA
jgi:hypothetical protein